MASPPVTSHSFWTTNCGLMICPSSLNACRRFACHSLDLLPPRASAPGVGVETSPDSQLADHLVEHVPTSPTIGDVDLDALEIDDGSMSIWMILRGIAAKWPGCRSRGRRNAGADGEQHVGVVHRHVGFEGAVHARHAERTGSVAGNRPGPSACW